MVAKTDKKKSFKGSGKIDEIEDIVLPLELADGTTVEVTALGYVPGIVGMEFLAGIQSDEGADNITAVNSYLKDSFTKEEYKKFIGVVKGNNGYEMGDIVGIATHLLEERSNRSLAVSSD